MLSQERSFLHLDFQINLQYPTPMSPPLGASLKLTLLRSYSSYMTVCILLVTVSPFRQWAFWIIPKLYAFVSPTPAKKVYQGGVGVVHEGEGAWFLPVLEQMRHLELWAPSASGLGLCGVWPGKPQRSSNDVPCKQGLESPHSTISSEANGQWCHTESHLHHDREDTHLVCPSGREK